MSAPGVGRGVFIVTGMFEGKPYGIALGPKPEKGWSWGRASGTTRVLALLASREGSEIRVTPVGPVVKVSRNDPASLLGALYVLTEVVDVQGERIPDVIPEGEDGFIF